MIFFALLFVVPCQCSLHFTTFCLVSLETKRIEKAAAYVAEKLNKPLFIAGAKQRGVKWIWLDNYIEQIAR